MACVTPVFADTIKLRDGNVVQAKIIDRSAEKIRANVEGTIVTYDLNRIYSINSQPVSAFSPMATVSATIIKEQKVQSDSKPVEVEAVGRIAQDTANDSGDVSSK